MKIGDDRLRNSRVDRNEIKVTAIVDRRGNIVRAWRVISRTPINLHDTPDVLRGAPTLVLDVLEGNDTSSRWEYEVLRLVPDGSPTMFSVPHRVFGDNILYFPMTAVGLHEEGLGVGDLTQREFEPFGLIEPLLWMLHMQGYCVLNEPPG